MPRQPRLAPADIPQHIIQKCNNSQICFADKQDMVFYSKCLKSYSKDYQVDIHAWVLMTNHLHLLVTPKTNTAISKMMQAVGSQYVRYFNNKYNHTGALWEGRYKSSMVQSDYYLLAVYRYIELNPVRATIVDKPDNYKFSSYQINALGKTSNLCTPHQEYLALGNNKEQRAKNYQQLFDTELNAKTIDTISTMTNKDLLIGDEKFNQQIEALTGRKIANKKRGRPVG